MAWLRGFGHCLPERLLTNATLADEFGVEASWILEMTGMETRRRVDEGETVCDLAQQAAERCLSSSGLSPEALGGIIVGTGTPDRRFPGVSSELQRRLSVPGIPAFDLHLPSIGSLFALALATDLCERYGPVLVVGAEAMTTLLARGTRHKETAILFGDGAGAALVCPGEGPLQVEDFRIASDGSQGAAISMEDGNATFRMDGRTVILQANRKLAAAIRDIVSRNGLTVEDVDLFLFHQANLNLIRQVGNSLKIDPEKVFVNIDRYGNTSCASVLIAASEAHAEGRFRPGAKVVFAGFGAGLSWGAGLVRCRG